MQRKWQRSWQRGKPECLKHQPVAKKNNVISQLAKNILPPMVAASMLLVTMTGAYANPTGGQVTTGAGTIAQASNTMTITQTTDKLGINWQSFGIGTGEKVQFIQPGANSVALNRVVGSNASAIYGTLSANGKVFLINPNGVLFAPGAQVSVGGLVASSLNISDSDFKAGKYKFNGTGGSVVNQGNITASDGSYVALLGGQVKNEGIIVAQKGTVALGAGSAITLDMNGDGLLNLAVNQGTLQALVENKNLIQADGGQVVMTARAAGALTETVVNNTGMIRARSVSNANGVIRLDGGVNGTVTNSGTLDASGKDAGQIGGTVKVLGNKVEITDQAKLDASGANGGGTILVGGNTQGQGPEQNATNTYIGKNVTINADAITQGNGGKVVVWADNKTESSGNISARGGINGGDGGNVEVSGKQKLVYNGFTDLRAPQGKTGNLLLDPTDYTIAASGGDKTGEDVANLLTTANVTILTSDGKHGGTNGDILVNDAVSWNNNNTLTLSAYRDVNVNANITATGNTAGLIITPGTGGSGSYNLNSGAKVTLSGTNPSLNIAGHSYTVINSLAALQNMNADLTGYYALGSEIDASATSTWNSGAGFVPIGGDPYNGGTVFTGVFNGGGHIIAGLTINHPLNNYVGLFGYATGGTISNLGLTNVNITGNHYVGGLVGANYGIVTNTYSTGAITSITDYYSETGGLVGYNTGIISHSYSSGAVTGGAYVGGLVGENVKGSIANSYSTGAVSGGPYTGGLVGGSHNGGSITSSSSCSAVSGADYVGGLVGSNSYSNIISDSWSTGTVSGTVIGGLVGQNSGSIDKSYSTGSVIGSADSSCVGGLVGYNDNSISHSYSSGGVSGISHVGGLVGVNDRGSVDNSYSTGAVSGKSYVGGLVGSDFYKGIITNCYSTGLVSGYAGSSHVGGLVGGNDNQFYVYSEGIITASYWDTQTSGQATSTGGTGLTTSQMMTLASYNGWDFANAWQINDGHTYPSLRGFMQTTQLPTLTIIAYGYDKVYNGLPFAGGNNVSYLGFINGDTSSVLLGTLSCGGSARGAVNADSYNITPYGFMSNKYNIVYVNGTLTINKATLTPGFLIGITKIYDGSTTSWDVVVNNDLLLNVVYNLEGRLNGDLVYIGSSAKITFDNKNVGTGKNVTVTDLSLSGADAGNYRLAFTNTSSNLGTITPKRLEVSDAGTVSKVYDGNTTAIINNSNFPLTGVVSGDNVGVTGILTYDNKNVGTLKQVTSTNLGLNGTDAGNYSLVESGGSAHNGTIVAKILDPILTGTAIKVYDGNTIAGQAGSTIWDNQQGVVSGDSLTCNWTSLVFDNKNVGTGKVVMNYGLNLSGPDAGNYQLSTTSASGNIGTITAKALTAGLTGTVAKIYDGMTAAELSNSNYSLTGLVSGDSLNLAGTGTYDNKNAGTGKTVMVTGLALSGGDAGNYHLESNSIGGNIGTITPKRLEVSDAGTVSKVYDGNTTAIINNSNFPLTGVISGDNVGVTGILTYDNKNVGTLKQVTSTNLGLNGTDAGNYSLVECGGSAHNGTITAKTLTAGLTGTVTKIYDGMTAAELSNSNYSMTGLVSGDDVSLAGMGTYDNKNVGTGKTVTISGLTLTGADANNYLLNSNSASAQIGIINPAPLTITAQPITKVYDGTTYNGEITPTVTGSLAYGDSIGVTERFDNKNVGTGKTLTPVVEILDGNDGKNYTVTMVNVTTGVINPAVLNATDITANNKIYDATMNVTLNSVSAGLGGVIGTDSVNLVATGAGGAFTDKNVGTSKTVNVSGLTLSGADAGNYSLSAYITTANITPASLTITALTNTKTFDGTTSATVMPTVNGQKGNDTVTGLSESYADENVGTNKTLKVNPGYTISDGNGGNNYSVTTVNDITGVINQVAQVSQTSDAYNGAIANAAQALTNGNTSGGTSGTFTGSFSIGNSGLIGGTNPILTISGGGVNLGDSQLINSDSTNVNENQ